MFAVRHVRRHHIGARAEPHFLEQAPRRLAQRRIASCRAPEAKAVALPRLHGEHYVLVRRELWVNARDLERPGEALARAARRR
jgi:hypothetical protein